MQGSGVEFGTLPQLDGQATFRHRNRSPSTSREQVSVKTTVIIRAITHIGEIVPPFDDSDLLLWARDGNSAVVRFVSSFIMVGSTAVS